MSCFKRPNSLISEIKERLKPQTGVGPTAEQVASISSKADLPRSEFFELTERLIKASYQSYTTGPYDLFQKMTNGIEK